MTEAPSNPLDERSPSRQPIRLPNFAGQKEIGLGDAIKGATKAVGFRPCDGCNRRAAALNRWVVFGPRT